MDFQTEINAIYREKKRIFLSYLLKKSFGAAIIQFTQ